MTRAFWDIQILERVLRITVVGEMTEAEEFLQSVQMIIGLLVWNIAITLFVFVLILVLICVCADIEKIKRRFRRHRYTDSALDPIGFDNGEVIRQSDVVIPTYDNVALEEMREADSDFYTYSRVQYDSGPVSKL